MSAVIGGGKERDSTKGAVPYCQTSISERVGAKSGLKEKSKDHTHGIGGKIHIRRICTLHALHEDHRHITLIRRAPCSHTNLFQLSFAKISSTRIEMYVYGSPV